MEDEEFYEDEDLFSYLKLCGEPTIAEGFRFARDLIIANVTLRLILNNTNLPHSVKHSLSLAIGSFLLHYNVGFAFFWSALLTLGSYVLMIILRLITKRHQSLIIFAIVVSFLLGSEFYIINPVMWQQIRGIQMIAAMKIISVSVDLERGLLKHIPSPAEFAGFVLCPANCILGPWISFHRYKNSLEKRFFTFHWFRDISAKAFLSIFCLLLSNCIIPWHISDRSSKWLKAYRDAQAFRVSHYFVSMMSQVSMIAAGFASSEKSMDIQVTKPLYIEFPRSLVQVVIYWNIPMHQWLKTYVFKSCQPYGQFFSILATYMVSSLLHGLNFQLSAVLLSVGTFSYVEYKFRSKVSSIFSACCLVNPCPKNCQHSNKGNDIYVRLVNLMFSLVAMMHLAYLGVMFEASFAIQESGYSYKHTLTKWARLDYTSHIVIAFTYLMYILI